jgi:hypothetical protein
MRHNHEFSPLAHLLPFVLAGTLSLFHVHGTASAEPSPPKNLQPDQLVAWCIVPFDAKQRGPAERAAMVRELGLQRVAYDWRNEHVPQFEEEILAYRDRGIEFFAFWSWHPEFAKLVSKYELKPQFWLTNPSPAGTADDERTRAAGQELLPTVREALAINCPVGLYNHGDWGGRPENLIAVCEWLRAETGSDQIGIVYNLHHAHDDLDDFARKLSNMKPYLLCLNLNGMNSTPDPKILPMGQGEHDERLMRIIRDSEYDGAIGILDHRPELDARESLLLNLRGLESLKP